MRTDENELIAEHNGDDKMTRKRYTGYDSQEKWQQDLRKYYNEEICGALTNKKKMCQKKPMENGRCRNHGGASPKGLDHPRTKHGGYSKYLPDALKDKYKEATTNEELLSLKDEMALVTTRLYELAEMVDEAGGKKKYAEIVDLWRRWHKAKSMDSKNARYIKQDLDEAIEHIEKDLQIWDEVTNLVNMKRKLVDSEQRKLNNLQQYVPTEKVMLFIGAVMDVVSNEIEGLEGVMMDEEMVGKTISTISKKIEQLSNKNPENYNPED